MEMAGAAEMTLAFEVVEVEGVFESHPHVVFVSRFDPV
jgi:hypothetical protein